MKINRLIYSAIGLLFISIVGLYSFKNFNTNYTIGEPVDSLNGVYVFYNGSIGNVSGRNTTADGYNLGLKYQCVEFVKRYYYEYLNHKMPDSYGHAKDFFDKNIADGNLNKKRNLTQYTNPSKEMPQVNDLLVFDETRYNKYGHVVIVSKVTDNEIEIIQQNPGPYGKSREQISIEKINDKWEIQNTQILGWLRQK